MAALRMTDEEFRAVQARLRKSVAGARDIDAVHRKLDKEPPPIMVENKSMKPIGIVGRWFMLPLPPTSNHAYPQSKTGKRFLSPDGKRFKRLVWYEIRRLGHTKMIEGRVRVSVIVHMARQGCDLANREKLLADSFTAAKVYRDDSQIDHFEIRRGMPDPKRLGFVRVLIEEMAPHLVPLPVAGNATP